MKKIITLLFSPAVRLMNRFNYTERFMIFGILSLITISIVISTLFIHLTETIKLLEKELTGIVLVEKVSKNIQLLQQHRGLSAGLLTGVQSMKNDKLKKAEQFKIALNIVDNKLPAPSRLKSAWIDIKSASDNLLTQGLTLSIEENYAAHTLLISQLLNFESNIADEYFLIFDAEGDTYYLLDTSIDHLPNILEASAQIRGLGTSILAKKTLSEQESVALSALVTERNKELGKLKSNLEKVGHYNPAIQAVLSQIYLQTKASTQEMMSIVEADILQHKFSLPADAFFKLATKSIDLSYQQLNQTLLPTTKELLKQRLAREKYTLYINLGVAFSLFIVVTYFTCGIYISLTHNIRTLTTSAHAFAAGDFNARIQLATQDEFKQIGSSFNEMADGFVALLAIRHEDDARLRAIFDASLDAMVQIDSDGTVTGWNNQATITFGWTAEETIGQKLHDLIIPPDYRLAHIQGMNRFLATGNGEALNLRFEITALRKNGDEFPIEIYINPFKLADKYEFTAFINDVTARKQYEDEINRLSNSELNKAKLEAEKANRAKSEFLSSMSHELRTPMNAVLGFAQLLELEDLTEDQLDSVQQILTSGHYLMDLINQVLDLAKIESESLDINLESFDLKNLVQNCLSFAHVLSVKNEISIFNNICVDCYGDVIADKVRLKQVLLNLISNAIKYNCVGGCVTLSSKVMNPKLLRINIEDTGRGLSEKQQAKLFQPFERLSAKNSNIEGSGIGLVISKKLIEAMNGKIGVESTVGIGSCFWIEIPLA